MNRYKKLLQLIFLVVGALFFVSVVKKIGWSDVYHDFLELKWSFIPVLLLSFSWYWLYTKGWQCLLLPFNDSLRTWELFKAKISGEAVNSVNPINFMVGDPVRIYLLKKDFPVKEGTASVVVDRTIHTMSILFIILLGIVVGFPILNFLPEKVQIGIPIFVSALTLLLAILMIFQHRGLFVLPFKLMLKLDIKPDFALRARQYMEELDDNIKTFYGVNKKGFFNAMIYHFVGRFLGIFEIFIFGLAIYPDFTFRTAILLGALGPIVNATFAFLPGALGVLEGAYGGLLYAMGMDPAIGVAIQIGRRVRALFWISIGIIFIGLHKKSKGIIRKELT